MKGPGCEVEDQYSGCLVDGIAGPAESRAACLHDQFCAGGDGRMALGRWAATDNIGEALRARRGSGIQGRP